MDIHKCEHGKSETLNLESFLDSHPTLKLLVLQFGSDLLANRKLRDILSNAIRMSGYLSALRVRSAFYSRRSSDNQARLVETVDATVLMRNDFPEDFKKFRDGLNQKRDRELVQEYVKP